MKGHAITQQEVPSCTQAHTVSHSTALVLPEERTLYDLADLFRIFADSSRIKILYALLESELCVCDLAQLLGVSQSAISHQLRVLKDSKLVRYRRSGKTVYYALDDDHVRTILSMGMEHISE